MQPHDTPDAPHKQCSKCKKLLPATSEYFGRCATNRDGLRYACKPCEASAERERQATKLERQKAKEAKAAALAQKAAIAPKRRCKTCDQELPLTYEYFQPDKSSKGGFKPRCRKCESQRCMELRKTRDNRQSQLQAKLDAGLRQCRVCDEWKPATLEFFCVRNCDSTGLNSMCKVCQAKSNALTLAERKSDPIKREVDRVRGNKASKEWNKRNREKVRQAARAYQQANKEKMRILTRRRKARKKGLPDTLTDQEWRFALDYFGGCCAYCGKPAGLFDVLCVEHYIPMASPDCPGTTADNCLPACHGGIESCNNKKHDKDPEEWILSHFGQRKGRKILKRIADYFATVRSTRG